MKKTSCCWPEKEWPVEDPSYDTCPQCRKRSLRAKELWEGGGVVCMTPGCGYWFCH